MPGLAVIRTRRRPILGLMALALVLAATPAAPAAGAAAGACSLPLTHDRYVGFHVGVPPGWELSTFGDTIVVSKSPGGPEQAVVYPALPTRGLTPATLYSAYSRFLQRSAAAVGSRISFHLTGSPGGLPQATISGRAGQVDLQGRASVRLVQHRTALAAYQLVYSAYVAPAARLAADGAQLAGIGDCYGPEAGTIYRLYSDHVFAMALPAGWKVLDEGQDNIDIVGDAGRAVASYLLLALPPNAGATSARSMVKVVFARLHIRIDRILSAADVRPQRLANGAVQGQVTLEFIGQFQGKAVHGLVRMISDIGSAVAVGVMRLGMTRAGRWNAVNSGLIQVVAGIQHNFAQDAAQWAHLMQQQRQFDQNEQQFDDIIRGVQEVRDPATGNYYEAPYDSYRVDGPNGPGYYLDNGGTPIKLQVV